MPRLLAYGGTSFTWRSRIGAWPELAAGYLQSKTGLFGGRRAVGFLAPPVGPALVLREIQNPESRGGYAYTLLLDPGEEVWERFGWNPAALASVLVGDEAARDALLAHPDALSPAALARLMEGLAPAVPGDVPRAGRLAELLAGASVTPPAPVVALALSAAELPESAGPAELASALAALPPCLRAGAGFLVHGSADVAAHLGARLLLDADERGEDVEPLASPGREAVQTFRALRGSPHADVAAEAESVPLWRWQERFGEPPETRLLALRCLARLEAGGAVPDEVFAALGHLRTNLAPRLAEAARHAALAGTGRLGPDATRFLLEQRVPLDAALAARLDAAAAVAHAAASGQPPDPALPAPLRLRIWRARAAAESPEELPALALAASWDLAPDDLGALLRDALPRWARAGAPLAAWAGALTGNPELARLAAEPLRGEALRRLSDPGRPDSWIEDYLDFARDEGGTAAAGALTQADARALVNAVAARKDDAGRAWLAALASSPLRELLDWRTELRVAYESGGGAWQPAVDVDRMLLGDPSLPHGRGTRREPWLKALRKGLEHLRGEGAAATVPALTAIVAFFGPLPKDVLLKLERLQPALSWESAERWLAGWRKLDQREREEEEFQRLVATADPPPLADLPEKARDRLVTWILHALRPQSAPARVARAQALLEPVARDDASRRLLDAITARHMSEAARLDLGKASPLLACLSEATSTTLLEKRLRAARSTFADDLARVKASGEFLKAARALVERDARLKKELSERRFEAWWEESFLERLISRFRDKGPRAEKGRRAR